MSAEVIVRDVFLRDGLQDEPVVVSVTDRLDIARRLIDAGVRELDVAAFVNPARVPQMIDAEAMVAGLPDNQDVRYCGLTLNRRGVLRAAQTRIDQIDVVVSASDGHSKANANSSTEDALTEIAHALQGVEPSRVFGAVSTAFESPFDGTVPTSRLVTVVQALVDLGIDRIGLADTMGTAEPAHVDAGVAALMSQFPSVEFALHLHDAHGRAFESIDKAVERGLHRFDSSVGGYGGCPFAPGAHGNLATEDLVRHLQRRGLDTGISPEALDVVVEHIRHVLARAPRVSEPTGSTS